MKHTIDTAKSHYRLVSPSTFDAIVTQMVQKMRGENKLTREIEVEITDTMDHSHTFHPKDDWPIISLKHFLSITLPDTLDEDFTKLVRSFN